MRELTVILIESNLYKGLFGPVQKKKKGEREIEREKKCMYSHMNHFFDTDGAA